MKFSPGDPVLIIGGLTPKDCKLIGHATIVTGQQLAFLMPDEIPFKVYTVEETYITTDMEVLYLYLAKHLMPLNPLNDEVMHHAQETEVTT